MKLLIAGITHFDVLGHRRLIEWLKQKSAIESGAPEFVAVEWDKDMFSLIKAQRNLIGELAREEWPTAPNSFVQVIQQSLGYEGDTHKEVLPSVETVWLDNGKIVDDETKVSQYYRDRMNIYKGFARNTCLDFSENMLINMSLKAWQASEPPLTEGTQRDIIFSDKIMSQIKHAKSDWAIVIVGANHASLSPGCMVSCLSEQGSICLPEELRPNWTDERT